MTQHRRRPQITGRQGQAHSFRGQASVLSPSIRKQSWVKYFLSPSFQRFPPQLPFLDQVTNSSQRVTFNSVQKLALADSLARQSDPSERKTGACPSSGANPTGSQDKALLSFQPHDPPLAPPCSSCNKHGASLPLSFRSQLRCDFLWNASFDPEDQEGPLPWTPRTPVLSPHSTSHTALSIPVYVSVSPTRLQVLERQKPHLSWSQHPAPRVAGT